MITAIQKYVCIQTRAKRKNENSCVRIARLWVNYFSFVSFPLLWLEHFILWNKEKSRGVYAAAQLTFKGWIRNLRNQYANSGHVQYLARVSILCFAWVPPITSLSQWGRLMSNRMLREAERPTQVCMRLQMTETGWDFTSILLQSPSPSCLLLPLLPSSLPSLGNSFPSLIKWRDSSFFQHCVDPSTFGS